MIFGIGTDIIEVSRVAREIVKSNGFRERYFSDREIHYCEHKHNKARNYAARFAAKEAFLKALGTGYRDGLAFKEVEVINDRLGKPEIVLQGRARDICRSRRIRRIHLSMTHTRNYANAVVILEM